MSRQRRKECAAVLTVLLLFVGSLMFSSLNGQPSPDRVDWTDFRAFLARRLEISHAELDEVFSQALATELTSDTTVDIRQVRQLETFLRRKFQVQGLVLLPNPFFPSPTEAGLPSAVEQGNFRDVPRNHPVYAALKPLLESGVECADGEGRIRPYEKLTWAEWRKVVGDLATRLSLEGGLDNPRTAERTGPMSNLELRNGLEHLRERLCIKHSAPLIWTGSQDFPSRLEGFGALANVLLEVLNPAG